MSSKDHGIAPALAAMELSTGVAWWLSHDNSLPILRALAYRLFLAISLIIPAIELSNTIQNIPYLY